MTLTACSFWNFHPESITTLEIVWVSFYFSESSILERILEETVEPEGDCLVDGENICLYIMMNINSCSLI